ncbi:hypothetical protein NL676_018400 [Syzygium grande]|nr:hypothetical protein NL676_018400 [Syzygium grande]
MKASLKFRKDRKPLIRAKIPSASLASLRSTASSPGDSRTKPLHLGTSLTRPFPSPLPTAPMTPSPFSLVVGTRRQPHSAPPVRVHVHVREFDPQIRPGAPVHAALPFLLFVTAGFVVPLADHGGLTAMAASWAASLATWATSSSTRRRGGFRPVMVVSYLTGGEPPHPHDFCHDETNFATIF